jgi:hypothetical protein
MIVLEIILAEDCPVDADRVRERLEPLVVDAIAEDLQERLAAYEEPGTGERANLLVKGNLRDGLEFAFNATSLDLVELVREQFAHYTALTATLSVTVGGPSLEQLRFTFDGPRDLVAVIDRRLRKGPLGGSLA